MLSFRFGTVGSPKSTPKSPGGSEGAAIHLRTLGLSAFEIGWVRSVRVSAKTCAKIKAAAAENDIALSVHAPYYINLNADAQEWPKSRKRLMDAARSGFLAGATDIVFHPGSYFERPAEEVLPGVIERLEGCVRELRAEGNAVTLRPETMGKGAVIGSLDDTLKMSAAIDGVEPCLDFPHLHARPGDGSMNTYAEWVAVLQAYANALGNESLRRLHIHLSGIEYTERGEQEHLPISESDLNLEAILQALIDLDCGGRILCESPILEEDALLVKETWQTLSEEN
jgi:deoxyribonuclease-4